MGGRSRAFKVDIDPIGRPGTRSATDPAISVTARQTLRDQPELAEISWAATGHWKSRPQA